MILDWTRGLESALSSIDSSALAIAALGLFGAGVVKGATGLGYATCALPFLVPAVGLKEAMALVLAPAVATNFGVALGAGHLRETLLRFSVFYIAILPGIVCGALLLAITDPEWAARILGLSILLYGILALAKPSVIMPAGLVALLQAPAGFGTGVLAGLTGSQVMPLLPYMMSIGLDPPRLVQAINLSVLVCSLVLAVTLLATGTVAWPVLVASLAALPLALSGVKVGTRLRQHFSPELFRTIMLIVLLIMGFALAAR